jgi:hypothetical protein
MGRHRRTTERAGAIDTQPHRASSSAGAGWYSGSGSGASAGGRVNEKEKNLDDARMEAIAARIAGIALYDVLGRLGVDPHDPIATQQDFAHLRKQRVAAEKVGEWTKMALIGAFITGALGVLVTGLLDVFKQ